MRKTKEDVEDIKAERVLQRLLKEKEIKDQGIQRIYTPVSTEMEQILKQDKFEKPSSDDRNYHSKMRKYRNQVYWLNQVTGYEPTHPDVLECIQNVLFDAVGDIAKFDIANLYYSLGMTYSDISYFLKDTPGDFNLSKVDEIMSDIKKKLSNISNKDELAKTLGIKVEDNSWVWN